MNEISRKEPLTINVTSASAQDENTSSNSDQGLAYPRGNVHVSARQYGQVEGGNIIDYGAQDGPDLDQIISNMATGVSNKISFVRRVNLANGWDVGTSPQEKSEDLTLGLRDGLCGALSSFSSWISSMVNLFRTGQIGQACVGLVIGIQLPIIAYQFGQYVSVYIFVWRCRREKIRDERRGYGIQLHTSDQEIPSGDFDGSPDSLQQPSFDGSQAIGFQATGIGFGICTSTGIANTERAIGFQAIGFQAFGIGFGFGTYTCYSSS